MRGKADVRIANHGIEDVRVTAWQIRHPLFDTIPPWERESVLPADGAARIVPVPFGAPLCDETEADGAVVLLQVTGADGAETDVVVALQDREPGLVRAHRLACAAQRVTDVARLDLAAPFDRATADGRPVLRARLTIERQGAGTVAVDRGSLTGNILFTVDTGTDEPLVLEDGEDAVGAEVVVAATRCEAHALTESKTSFTFALFASVDGLEPAQVQLTVGDGAREALQSLLDDTCGPSA
ncbi:MAG TPA: hypothetical protein VNU26_10120 [Mycobacteriales bacterium]|nr:hypothetical protein [Mycobacteriales bacterium]